MRWWVIAALVIPGGIAAGLVAAPFVWAYRRSKTRNAVTVTRPTLRCMKGGRK